VDPIGLHPTLFELKKIEYVKIILNSTLTFYESICTVGCPVGISMTGFCKQGRGLRQQKERIKKYRVENIFYASVLKIRDSVLLHVTKKAEYILM
jgi:hypothetical protein